MHSTGTRWNFPEGIQGGKLGMSLGLWIECQELTAALIFCHSDSPGAHCKYEKKDVALGNIQIARLEEGLLDFIFIHDIPGFLALPSGFLGSYEGYVFVSQAVESFLKSRYHGDRWILQKSNVVDCT